MLSIPPKARSTRHKVAALLGLTVALYANRFLNKRRGHARPGIGLAKVESWLSRESTTGKEVLGVTARTFRALEKALRPACWVEVKGRRGSMSLRERLGIFLYICRFAGSCRQVGDVFGRAPTSVGFAFRSIVNALVTPEVYNKHVVLPTSTRPVHESIACSSRLGPFFKDVVGAIDGSHVRAHAPTDTRDRFWNRKGWTSFNVLAACDFDMCFIYVLSGWEGSASDSFLWARALESGLQLPKGKQLLGDSGFGLSTKMLIPYRGVRYHLKEFAVGTRRPRNAKEVFNRRHAGVRSVIERIFGVMQARFKILITGCYFDMQVQADVFPALAVVHNIIRRTDPDNDIEPLVAAAHSQDDEYNEDEDGPQSSSARRAQDRENAQATAYRDDIADRMWNTPTF